MNSEIRKDYIQEKYVIIAPTRAQRPSDTRMTAPQLSSCPFDPLHKNHETGLYTIQEGGREYTPANPADPWIVKVIENKYPAVTRSNPRAYGKQEVVIESPEHTVRFETLPPHHIAHILFAYSRRTEEITRDPRIAYVLIFKNQGVFAGASLLHPHSQIFATAFIPPHIKDKSRRTRRYKKKTRTCVYCEIIERETHSPRRIYRDNLVSAFCPYAPLHAYEVWIMPTRHLDNITLLTAEERTAFSGALQRIVKKVSERGMDYNYYFHQVVRDSDQHLYLKITPRALQWAGVEIGSGISINTVPPEEAAAYYRGETDS